MHPTIVGNIAKESRLATGATDLVSFTESFYLCSITHAIAMNVVRTLSLGGHPAWQGEK